MRRDDREAGGQDSTSSPRAFVTATGFIHQLTGGVQFAMGVIYFLASGMFAGDASTQVESVADYFAPQNWTGTCSTVGTLAAVAGGLGLVAVGIGMQGERAGSPGWAMVTSGVLTACGITCAVVFAIVGAVWGRMTLAVIHACGNGVLFLLAGHSRTILKRYPPPADQNVVDDEWLEAYARKRRHQ